MNLKKIIFLCLCACLGVSLSGQSYVLQEADLTYTQDGIITDCTYNFAITNIIIPNTVNGVTITGINDINLLRLPRIFSGKGITNVGFPSTLKSIGNYSFRYNALTTLELPDGLERIGEYAFAHNSLTQVVIPNSVTFIGKFAFSDNSITEITLPETNIPGFRYWIDNLGNTHDGGSEVTYEGNEYRARIVYVLQDDDVEINENGMITECLYDFTYKDILIPETLKGIRVTGIVDQAMGVFAQKGLLSIELPGSMTHIGEGAFASNRLSSITIPEGVKHIGKNAFRLNPMTEVNLPGSLRYIGQQAFWNMETIVLPTPNDPGFAYWISSNGTTHQGGAIVQPAYDWFEAKVFYTLTDDDVVINNGIIEECSYNFSSKYIKIPNSLNNQHVTGIADGYEFPIYNYHGVFSNKGIKDVILPPYLESIGDYAFYQNNLTDKIILPNNVRYIGIDAFTLNSSFNGVVLPSPENGSYSCINWKDNYNNVHEVGSTIANFYERIYTAQFSYPAGTSIIVLSGSLNFGNVDINSESNRVLTIKNDGNSSFTVSNIILPDGYTADWTNGEINPDESQVVNITFSPNEVRPYSGEISVISDATEGINLISVSGTVLNATSVTDASLSNQGLRIYPNPTNNFLFIQNATEYSDIEILNLNGTVISKAVYNNRIDVSGLANGMYILRITNKETSLQAIFIKQ